MKKARRPRSVTLTITEACNLNCTYCYENHKSKESMTFETAKKIIDAEMKLFLQSDYDEIDIDFFGGEPFLYFDMIRQVDAYISEHYADVNYLLFVTTNGTLVHGEIQEWLKSRTDYFICGLSYDGTPKMQNINRSGSSANIDLEFFRQMYPEQGIKMTISKETLPDLAKGVLYLQEKGFEVSCNLAYGLDWSDPINEKMLSREIMKLITYYLEHPDVKPCSMLDMPISNVAVAEEKKTFMRYCGAGIETIAYHIDGTAYPCQFFMPLAVGKELAEASHKLKFYNEDIPSELIEKKCASCVAQSICPTCFGSNYAATGDMYKHEDNYCKLTKIMLRARSFFMAKRWELKQIKFPTPQDEQLLLKSIQIIQDKL